MKIIALLFALLVCSVSLAAEIGNACSASVCVDYKTDVPFVSKQEGRFLLTLTSYTPATEITLVRVDLWMQMGQHGHGSSPLKVVQVAPNQFDVTKAFFVMKGQWQIRVTFINNGIQDILIIPVMIKE